jgi:RNA polymerase sigma-70 factor (ECF subfamily)
MNFIMSHETNQAKRLSHLKEWPAPGVDQDRSLVEQTQKGSLDAFERLVSKHQKRMLNIAFRMIGDYEEACESVQDAFLAAYRHIGTFRGDAKFSTWLTTITLNHARNKLKQVRSRALRISYTLDTPVETGDGTLQIDPPSREPSPLDRLEKQDRSAKVRDCIEALEPEYREVIILRDLHDFSYQDIGSSLNVREGTVKSRLFRAREAVKDCLKKAWGDL